ncbi:VOC family protein [Salisediminibacterium beveridgei]|uniref:Glyoxalase family protein n=1 Tax=Salisediminibacterium beveridgei TaxID=632773 RepID=A0A1D7QY05_9BACI|nr:VOC family protein [Salisediminibacterium beveridgei]AOM83848.1 Glyoxalase family protein [Salisediminibacterium beveridgei]
MNFHHKPVIHTGPVKLIVSDLDQSISFYQDVIGLVQLSRNEDTAVLGTSEKQALLELKQPEQLNAKPERSTGLYHFAILLPDREHLAAFVRHIAALKIPVGSADHLVSEAVYLDDPDGNGIEVYRDRHPDEWQWENGQVKMTVDPLNVKELLRLKPDLTWEEAPAGTVMGHVHLHVTNLEETERFYVEGLGLKVVCRFGNQALFISDGDYHHHFGLNTWMGEGAPPTAANSVGLVHATLHFPSQAVLDQRINQLHKLGAKTNKRKSGLFVEDPSGNGLLLVV